MPGSTQPTFDVPPREQHEFDKLVDSFVVASDRVRNIMLLSVVTSIVVFAAYRNAMPNGWFESRVETARICARNKLWQPNTKARLAQQCGIGKIVAPVAPVVPSDRFVDKCKDVSRAFDWLNQTRRDEKSFNNFHAKLEEERLTEIQMVKVPLLGIEFDVNDLGFLSSIGLCAIALVLCFAMARHHENLYLCLWKIRRLAEREGRYNDGNSQANFLYHILAMAQVFNTPPTVNHWKRLWPKRLLATPLFFLPILAQYFVVRNDWSTIQMGLLFNRNLTYTTLGIQIFVLAVLLISTTVTISYFFVSDVKWAATFFELNPALKFTTSARWWYRTFPEYFPRYRFRLHEGALHLANIDQGYSWNLNRSLDPGRHNLARPISHMIPPPALFEPARLTDGSFYAVNPMAGKIIRCKSYEEDRDPESSWVQVGVIASQNPHTLIYTDGVSIKRIVADEKEKQIGTIPAESGLQWVQRIEEMTVWAGHLLARDRASKILKIPLDSIDAPDLVATPFMDSKRYRLLAVSSVGDRLYVAFLRRRKRWLWKVWKWRDPVRLLVLDPPMPSFVLLERWLEEPPATSSSPAEQTKAPGAAPGTIAARSAAAGRARIESGAATNAGDAR